MKNIQNNLLLINYKEIMEFVFCIFSSTSAKTLSVQILFFLCLKF